MVDQKNTIPTPLVPTLLRGNAYALGGEGKGNYKHSLGTENGAGKSRKFEGCCEWQVKYAFPRRSVGTRKCAAIVPDGVLFGSSKAHQTLRKTIVEEHKLDAVISMPSGVFKPYAGVSTAVIIFTRTDSGGTEDVFFYDMQADGYSLDDKRDKVEDNDIPDIIKQYGEFCEEKTDLSDRKAKAFAVPKEEIADNKYDLSINRYKEIEYEEVECDPPLVILDQLDALEKEIQADLKELRGML